ncbi:MAG: Ig-like domain-containing protein [Pseudomonadota bacterium]
MALTAAFSDLETRQVVTVEPDGSGTLVAPDANLLFGGAFLRSGADLLIENADAPTLLFPNYFSDAQPADIHAPNGSVLRGQTAEVLAGPLAPGDYAQQGPVPSINPIGQVENFFGTATVQRLDGTIEQLGPDSQIFLGDLVETGSASRLSLTFVDGTIFTLSADARMVIDELVYDPAGTDNSATFNLIEGAFVFIAGQIAPTGGIDIITPTSTMGIRGTTVLVDISTVAGVVTVEISLLRDPDGSIGLVQVFDLDGNPIADIDSVGTKWVITSDGSPPLEVDRTAEEDASDSVLITEAVAAFQAASQRVLDGGDFVTPTGQSDGVTPDAAPVVPPSDLDVDSQDDAPSVPSTPSVPPSAPSDSGEPAQQDGRLDLRAPETPLDPPLAPSVTVAGEEDPAADTGIPGQILAGSTLPVTFTLLSQAENGFVSLVSDGSFTYVPNPDFNGQDQFSYQVTDSEGRTDVGNVTILVAAVNDAPEVSPTAVTVVEDGVVSGEIAGVDVDGDTLGFSLVSSASQGVVALTTSGTFTYVPNPDFAGSDQFTVSVSDGAGGVAESFVTVTVTNVNDTPVVTSTPSDAVGETEEDGTLSTKGQLQASDVDTGDSLVWSGSSDGVFGRFEIDADTGAWTYTLNNEAVQSFGAGQTAVEAFQATVTDLSGASATQTVSLTITGTNDAPVVVNPPSAAAGATVEDAATSTQGQLLASDIDTGDSLVWSGSADGEFGRFEIDADTGAWTYTLDNEAAQAFAEGQVVVESFEATVTDVSGASATQTVTVTITGANDAPEVSNVVVQESDDGTLSGSLSAIDLEGDGAVIFGLGETIPENGVVTVNPDGTFSYIPNPGFRGVDQFSYIAEDSDGGVSEALVSLLVASASETVDGGQNVSISIDATAGDPILPGQIQLVTEAGPSSAVNVALVVDWSFSVSPAQIEEAIASVAQAISDIALEFEGSETQVDVRLIALSSVDGVNQTFDLQDVALGAAISSINFASGSPASLVFAAFAANEFFAAEPAEESNFLYVVAPGSSPVELSAFTGTAQLLAWFGGYDLSLDILTYGRQVDPDVAQALGISTTPLDGPDSFVDEFDVEPVFSPDLVELSVGLFVDGEDLGEIADETSSALVETDDGISLDVADIAGIEGLLGDDNILIVEAGFDLDGDASTTELTLFTSETLGGPQTTSALAAGRSIAQFDIAGDLTGALLALAENQTVDAVDIDNGLANSLTLTGADILGLSDRPDALLGGLLANAPASTTTIYGDTGDEVTFVSNESGSFSKSSEAPVEDGEGNTLALYNFSDNTGVVATVAVDAEVAVTVATAQAS